MIITLVSSLPKHISRFIVTKISQHFWG